MRRSGPESSVGVRGVWGGGSGGGRTVRRRLGGGEGDSRTGLTGRSREMRTMAGAGGSGSSCAFSSAVGSEGRGSNAATCSRKCVQSVEGPMPRCPEACP